MTRDARVERLLVVALEQAIGEALPPARAEFYDHWLGREGLRDGTLGMAQMTAVAGFLRTEGEGYRRVVERAGQLVAAWAWDETPAWRRRGVQRLPIWLRVRVACRRLTRVAAATASGTIVRAAVARRVVTLRVSGSVFCGAREAPAEPLCAFYAALLTATFAAAGLAVGGQMEQCRAGTGAGEKGRACLGSFAVSSPP